MDIGGNSVSVGYLLHAFDLINIGDLDLIRQARDACEELVVGVLPDDVSQAILGRVPVVPEGERVSLVAHVRGVDRAILHAEDSIPESADVYTSPGVGALLGLPSVELYPATETTSLLLRKALRPQRSEVA
jgi:hypothetical protein